MLYNELDIESFHIPEEYEGYSVREIADLAPIRLNYYATIGGQEINSNSTIETYTLNWLKQHSTTKSVSAALESGIKSRKIVIGYLSTSKFKFILHRLIQNSTFAKRILPSSGDGILGYYSPIDKRLVIVLDENVSFMGEALREIPTILMHELIHMAFNHNPDSLLKATMNKTLLPFYRHIITSIDDTTSAIITDTQLQRAIREIAFASEAPNQYEPARVADIVKIWTNLWKNTGLDTNRIDRYAYGMVLPFIRYISEKNVGQHSDYAKRMAMRFYAAYDYIGSREVRNLSVVGQEGMVISEVLSMQNMNKPRPEVSNVINRFKF